MDYALYQALTGPMANAGLIQQQRDANAMRQMQFQQQQQNQQLQQANRQNAMQQDLINAANLAQKDLYTKNNFSRQKDIDDFVSWHEELSGWGDIQNVLRTHGSVDNARLYGNLDYLVAEYKNKLMNNPISLRVNKNKASLELYHAHAQDPDGNGRFITQGSKQRYNNFLSGKTDAFVFTGPRSDYLGQAMQVFDVTNNLDLDDIINSNHVAIQKDMYNDTGLDPNQYTFTREDMKMFLNRELQTTNFGGVTYFGGEAYYGSQEIDTTASLEFQKMLESTGNLTGAQYFENYNLDKGNVYSKDFATGASQNWQRFGGVDNSKTAKDYSDDNYGGLTKGRQLVTSTRILTDPTMETQMSNAVFGQLAKGVSRYNAGDRRVDNVSTAGLFDSRGRMITQEDIDAGWYGDLPFIEDFTGEDAIMDNLYLEGYFVGYQGKSADGRDILLTDVTNEEDRKKLQNEYKNIVFQPVIIAELRDDDLITADDHYYKVVDMSSSSVNMSINDHLQTDKLETVLNDQAIYEQRKARNDYYEAQKVKDELKLQKLLNQSNQQDVDKIINSYDQQLTVGLGMASIPSVQIQQAVPLLMADLYLDSQQDRAYPFDFTPNETDPNKKRIANNSGEYMAYSTMFLKEGLTNGNPQYKAMLDAIRNGNYNAYSRTIYGEKEYNQRRNLSKQIINKQRN
mgnify:FL=1|tara:strand:+ start:3844 stop:5889 length:2046 start_codon:yes stop_codon:yes gene_type:complete